VALPTRAIDRYLRLAGPTAANLQQRSAVGEWDTQTDTVPFHRPCSTYYAGTGSAEAFLTPAFPLLICWRHQAHFHFSCQ